MATRKIETELKLTGEAEFNDQMKSVNNNLKNLKAEMGAVSTSFDENASATDKLKAQQNILTQEIDQQQEKVRALTEMYEECKSELGENAAKTDKYKQAMLNAQTALNKMQAENRKLTEDLKKNEKALEDSNKKLTEYVSITKRAKERILDFVGGLKKYAFAIKEAAQHTPVFAEALDAITLGAKGAKLALKGAEKIGGTALTGTVKSFAALGAASVTASVGLTTLATVGFKKVIDYALEAAKSGNPAFEGLAKNLTALESASKTAEAALGNVLRPALVNLSYESTKLLRNFSAEVEAAGTDTEAIGKITAKYIREAANMLRKEGPQFIKAGAGLISGLSKGIIENADDIGDASGELIEELADSLDENAEDLGKAAAVLVETLGSLIAENAPELLTAGVTMVESLLEGLDGEKLGETAADLVVLLLTTLMELAPELFSAGAEFVGAVIDGLIDGWPEIKEAGKDLINEAWNGMKELWEDIKTWFFNKVDELRGTAYIDVQVNERGFSGKAGKFATGLDYVPYDNYPAILHCGEMVVPASLASQMRNAGINKNTQRLDNSSGGATEVQVTNHVSVSFEGSLAQLARVLQPYIKAEEERRGPLLIK